MVTLSREFFPQNLSFEPKMFNKFFKDLVVETIESLPFTKPEEKKLVIIDFEISNLINFLQLKLNYLFDEIMHLKLNSKIESKCHNIIYLVRPSSSICRIIENQIITCLNQNIYHDYFIIFVPNYSV